MKKRQRQQRICLLWLLVIDGARLEAWMVGAGLWIVDRGACGGTVRLEGGRVGSDEGVGVRVRVRDSVDEVDAGGSTRK